MWRTGAKGSRINNISNCVHPNSREIKCWCVSSHLGQASLGLENAIRRDRHRRTGWWFKVYRSTLRHVVLGLLWFNSRPTTLQQLLSICDSLGLHLPAPVKSEIHKLRWNREIPHRSKSSYTSERAKKMVWGELSKIKCVRTTASKVNFLGEDINRAKAEGKMILPCFLFKKHTQTTRWSTKLGISIRMGKLFGSLLFKKADGCQS